MHSACTLGAPACLFKLPHTYGPVSVFCRLWQAGPFHFRSSFFNNPVTSSNIASLIIRDRQPATSCPA